MARTDRARGAQKPAKAKGASKARRPQKRNAAVAVAHTPTPDVRADVSPTSEVSGLALPVEDRYALFVEHYLATGCNATEAAKRTGYAERSAHVQGSTLLRNPKVQALLRSKRAELAEAIGITAEELLREYRALALSDVHHFTVDDFGNVRPTADAPERATRAIQSVKRRVTHHRGKDGDEHTTYDAEYRLHPKLAALDKLSEVLGVTTPAEKQPATAGVTIILGAGAPLGFLVPGAPPPVAGPVPGAEPATSSEVAAVAAPLGLEAP